MTFLNEGNLYRYYLIFSCNSFKLRSKSDNLLFLSDKLNNEQNLMVLEFF